LVQRFADVAGIDRKHISVEAQSSPLREVLLSLGWTDPVDTRAKDYLDGSCLIYSEDQILDIVDYRGSENVRQKQTKLGIGETKQNWSAGKGDDASVMHSGDVLTATGGSHVIRLKLDNLPGYVTDCFFVLSAYNCRDLSRLRSPTMCLFDADFPTHQLCTYTVQDAGCAAAVVVCSISRERDVWAVRGFGQTCDATVRDYTPVKNRITSTQDHYVRWQRRSPCVLLWALWNADRALPRAAVRDVTEDILFPLFDLPASLFQHILRYV